MGGHSLSATILLFKIAKEFQVKIPVQTIFTHQDIRSLGKMISASRRVNHSPITRASEKDHYVCSSVQRRLYFVYEFDKGSTAYNMPKALKMSGLVDEVRLQTAFENLIQRHESLRTTFAQIDGEPCQRISNTISFVMERGNCGEDQIESRIRAFIRPFNLEEGPLMRVGLLTQSEYDHILLVDMHHIISDGTSQNILIKDFMSLYNGEHPGDLPLQYKDYAEWQQDSVYQDEVKRQGEYWMKEYSEIPGWLELPCDFPRPLVKETQGNSIRFRVNESETHALKSLGEKSGTTLFMIVLSLYNILLSKLSNQEDIVIGTSTSGRQHADLEDVIGMLVNTLPVRNYPEGDLSFEKFLATVKEKTLKCFDNQFYQYEDLIDELKIERNTSRNPLFDVYFLFHNYESSELKIPGLSLTHYHHEMHQATKFDLTLSVDEFNGELYFNLAYCLKLFTRETVERFVSYFKNIVSSVIANPSVLLSQIDILPEEEKRKLLIEFNDTTVDHQSKDKTIVDLFRVQVKQVPGKVAVVSGETQLTYEELDARSTSVAMSLKKVMADSSNRIVALYSEPSAEMIIGVLGILKSGGCFLPLDTAHPKGRLENILRESGSRALLTQSHLAQDLSFDGVKIVVEEAMRYDGDAEIDFSLSSKAVAYVIYTSGSTGTPKGVKIRHDNAVNYILWLKSFLDLGSCSKTVLTSSYAFDLGYSSVFPVLASGGELHIVKKTLYQSPDDLLSYISDKRISYLKMTPSLFSSVVDCPNFSGFDLSGLSHVMLGGEPMRGGDLEKAHSHQDHLRFVNHYGPTETTIGVIASYIDDIDKFMNRPALGRPIHNTGVYILDRRGSLLPIGVSGELCIGGSGVGDGYLNREDLTAEKFVKFSTPGGTGLIYRTGDRARWLGDGRIEFLGRMDEQVKIRGYRIECGEIESQLSGYRDVSQVKVVVRPGGDDNFLVAFYVSDQELDVDQMKRYLGDRLPEYMVPSYYVHLERLPLTLNGKLDTKALLSYELHNESAYEGASSEMEERLVDIWSKVLKLSPEKISITRSFFEMGGHSLSAIQILASIHRSTSVKIPVQLFFKESSIVRLASYIEYALMEKSAINNLEREELEL
jgi:amino acid adenylation domain-containing protein